MRAVPASESARARAPDVTRGQRGPRGPGGEDERRDARLGERDEVAARWPARRANAPARRAPVLRGGQNQLGIGHARAPGSQCSRAPRSLKQAGAPSEAPEGVRKVSGPRTSGRRSVSRAGPYLRLVEAGLPLADQRLPHRLLVAAREHHPVRRDDRAERAERGVEGAAGDERERHGHQDRHRPAAAAPPWPAPGAATRGRGTSRAHRARRARGRRARRPGPCAERPARATPSSGRPARPPR